MLSTPSYRLKRRALIGLLCLAPLVLFAVTREKLSWKPRFLPLPSSLLATDVAWMADNRTLAIRTRDKVVRHNTLQFWDAKSFSLVRSAHLKDGEFAEYFARSGLISVYNWPKGGTLSLSMKELNSGKTVSSFDFEYQESLRHSADGRAFCVVKQNTSGPWPLRIYQVSPLRLLREPTIQPPPQMRFVQTSAVSPDLKIVTLDCSSASRSGLKGMLLFDTEKKKRLTFLRSAYLPPTPVPSFSDDSQTLLIGGYGIAQLRDARSGQLKRSLRAPTTALMRQLHLPSGKENWLIGCAVQSIFVWNAASGQLLREIKLPSRAETLSLAPDGSTLAVITDKNEVFLCRMR